MFPVLFEIPNPFSDGDPFPIRMFGVLVILGFLFGQWAVARRLTRQELMTKQQTFDFCFYLLVAGIVGARMTHVLQEFETFRGRPLEILKIWEGGLVWYGGFALSAVFAAWWIARNKLPVARVADAAVIGLALALAIGRWGCFCAGDDFGAHILDADGLPIDAAEDAPWYAVQFPDAASGWRYRYSETPLSFRTPYWLHPVQIYMSIANVAVLGVLLFLERAKNAAARPGLLTGAYMITYPIGRFIVETWRGDEDRGVDVMGTGLSFSQVFGIPVFLIGILIVRSALRGPRPKPKPPGQAAAAG